MKYLFVAMALFLTGCVSTYRPPIGVETASILFPYPSSDAGWGYSNQLLLVVGDIDNDGCAVNRQRIDEEVYDKEGMKVPAGKEIFVQVGRIEGRGTTIETCEIGGAITFQQNKEYKVVFNTGAGHCNLSILDVESGDSIEMAKMKVGLNTHCKV